MNKRPTSPLGRGENAHSDSALERRRWPETVRKFFGGTLFPIVAGCVLMTGCAVGPNYTPPKAAVRANFAETNQMTTTNAPAADWWKSFQDPELDLLITEALRQNYDLQAAYARIRQARDQRNIAAADLFPQADADGGYAYSRGSKNVVLSLGGTGGGGSGGSGKKNGPVSKQSDSSSGAGGGSSGGGGGFSDAANDSAFDDQLTPLGKGGLPGVNSSLYQAGFDASWEIDVFGGKRRLVEAANAELQASKEQRRDMELTLMAEVARDYFELRGSQERLGIAEKNLKDQDDTLELVRSRAHSGLATDADVARAAAEAATTEATLPPLKAQNKQLMHALAVLIAREPAALSEELAVTNPLPALPPVIPIGLPSQLMERRPDIRAAERQIAANNARVGSAEADLFPKFALIGSAGLDSSTINNLFEWDSRYFLISPTVTWRIFDAGRILSNIRLQKAMKEESVLQFQSTVLKALQEVEDLLVNYAMERERIGQLEKARNQNQLALQLVRQRYEHGLVTYLDVLDAERTVLSSEDNLTQSNVSEMIDLIALYKALGGGWKTEIRGR